jgi:catechol 2,3-dioxygenase-like lactoylglutathione lyase family enzyme
VTGFRLSSTVLAAPDPRELAAFYRELLDWEIRDDEPDWVVIKPRGTGQGPATGLAFQRERDHEAPRWPATPGDQQMQAHLDIGVPDLAEGVARATALGAREAAVQPQEDVRVMLDPAGHPFCLFADPLQAPGA